MSPHARATRSHFTIATLLWNYTSRVSAHRLTIVRSVWGLRYELPAPLFTNLVNTFIYARSKFTQRGSLYPAQFLSEMIAALGLGTHP